MDRWPDRSNCLLNSVIVLQASSIVLEQKFSDLCERLINVVPGFC
jgi:hypothetical protein